MKILTKNVIIIIGLFSSLVLKSQVVMDVLNADHPTVESLKVTYKGVAQSSLDINNDIQVIPEGLLILKQNVNVVKIYLKIINRVVGDTIYEANYQTNSSVVTNNNGKKLFENNEGSIFISNGENLGLKPYTYEIQTEDSEGNLSTVFSIIQ